MERLVIYTIPICSECKLLKGILDKYQIKYREEVHKKEFMEKYPVIFYDGKELDYNSFMKEYKQKLVDMK